MRLKATTSVLRFFLFLSLLLLYFPLTAQQDTNSFIIRCGDVLDIEVMEHPEFNRRQVLVLPDGRVQYPAIGSIQVAGRTAAAIADTLQQALAGEYVVDPVVTVYVNKIQSQYINVFGYVNSPGRYQIFEPVDLITAISVAGGFREIKPLRKIIINRASGEVEVIRVTRSMRKGNLQFSHIDAIDKGDTIIIIHRKINWSQYSFIATISLALLRLVDILV